MPSRKNHTDTEEPKCKSSKKVVDEADRLRKKAELEQLRKEEEESNNRLEAIRLQKSPKIRCQQAAEIPPLNIPPCLQTEQEVEEKRKKQNKIKSSKKKAKQLARQKQLEAEIAKSKKISSSIATPPLQQNLNHANFFEEPDVGEEEVDELSEEEAVEQLHPVPIKDLSEEENEETDEEENEGDFVFVTQSLECVSIEDSSSPTSVAESETESVPPLDIGKPSLNEEEEEEELMNSKKKGKSHSSKGSKGNAEEGATYGKKKKQQKPLSEKKQAKEALKAAYAAFEAKMLPGIKEENPKLRNKEHREIAAAMWLRHPENPSHPNHKLYLAHEQK